MDNNHTVPGRDGGACSGDPLHFGLPGRIPHLVCLYYAYYIRLISPDTLADSGCTSCCPWTPARDRPPGNIERTKSHGTTASELGESLPFQSELGDLPGRNPLQWTRHCPRTRPPCFPGQDRPGQCVFTKKPIFFRVFGTRAGRSAFQRKPQFSPGLQQCQGGDFQQSDRHPSDLRRFSGGSNPVAQWDGISIADKPVFDRPLSLSSVPSHLRLLLCFLIY